MSGWGSVVLVGFCVIMSSSLSSAAAPSRAGSPGSANHTAAGRTVMAWMGWGGRTDTQIDTIVHYFTSNRDAITTASPTAFTLGPNATLLERNLSKAGTYTRQQVFKRLRQGGVRVLPTIWNDASGMKYALLPMFLQLASSPDAFIAQAVAVAVAEDLDGWNVDFELGAQDWDAGDCRLVWPDPRWGTRVRVHVDWEPCLLYLHFSFFAKL